MTSQAITPNSPRAWLLACRTKTLPAAAAPVLVGSALAFHQDGFRAWPGLACLVGAFLLQIASNFANDVFDFEKGADTEERLGPQRAVQSGLVSARGMKSGLGIVIALSLLVGTYLVWTSGLAIVVIGLASILAAVAYTGGPYPLGYHGLGDVFVMLFFGFVAVCGTAYVHLGFVPTSAWLGALGVGSVVTNILVVNNLRDRHTDVHAGKRTLAVRLGRRGAVVQYVGLYVISYLVPLCLWLGGHTGPHPLAAWLTIPVAVRCVNAIRSTEGTELNRWLAQSAKLVFLYGFTLSLGIVASALSYR